MAKSDSFFIRASVPTNNLTFNQVAIDLGAYVDALGKSVLRLHSTAVSYGSPLNKITTVPSSDHAVCAFQLTTQSQASMVNATNKSTISTGQLLVSGDPTQVIVSISESLDIAPQMWKGGYLVGVEQIYLGVDQVTTDVVDEVTIVLECTVETLNASAAMALALSQQ